MKRKQLRKLPSVVVVAAVVVSQINANKHIKRDIL